ncbi:host-nuclease inhibitor Gam family protein [Cohnella sp. GCM10020058]|uniref:host-nuclease inhibitor Gam family protein n=1 Tax=Cohnella sp. GCM10020058 TaxID=3317330 RepID=UPI00362B5B2A
MNALQINDFNLQPENERFQVETIDQANWALRKLAAIEAKRKEVNELAAAETFRIKSWQDSELSKLSGDAVHLETLLSEFAVRQRELDPKWKKTTTPYGEIKFRKQQPKWHYDDPTLVESLRMAGRDDLIRTKEEPNKVELKKLLQVSGNQVVDPLSGSILEGIAVEEQPDAVVVEVTP